MLASFPPEIHFLFQCVRLTQTSTEEALGPNFDWDLLFRAAEKNLVIPLVYQALTSVDSSVAPAQILEKFKTCSGRIMARNIVLRREMAGLLRLFQEQQIPVIPFKGPILTERLYENAGLRLYDDLDVLIHKEDIDRTQALLFSLGYRLKDELLGMSSSQDRAYRKTQYTYDYYSRNLGHQFELHWELLPKNFNLPLDYDQLWSRCEETEFEGLRILQFAPEDLLFILCISGAKKNWAHLLRVCDLQRAIVRYGDVDWLEIRNRARRSGAERILFTGLALSSTLFEMPLPSSIQGRMEQSKEVKSLVERIITEMFDMNAESSDMIQPEDQFQPMHVRIRERFSDRMAYCFKVTFTPGVGEWHLITLPAPLYFLYYLIRPARLLSKAASRLIRSFRRTT